MNQKMIIILPTSVTCTTSIHKCETSSPQIITSENLPHATIQTKKETLRGAFTPQMLFKVKGTAQDLHEALLMERMSEPPSFFNLQLTRSPSSLRGV